MMATMLKRKLARLPGLLLSHIMRGNSIQLMMNTRTLTSFIFCQRCSHWLSYASKYKILALNYSQVPTKEEQSFSHTLQLGNLLNDGNRSDKLPSEMQSEKYHTIRTPRLFQLGRPSYADIAILPLQQAIHQGDVFDAHTILHQLNEGSLGDGMRTVALTDLFQSLFCLRQKPLLEIVVCSKFEFLLSSMSDCCPSLSQQDFESFVFHLAALRYRINILKISKHVKYCVDTFYEESLNRNSDWQLKRLLKVSDAFCLLRTDNSSLVETVFQRMEQMSTDLKTEEIIQLIYLAGEYREVPKRLMKNLESRVLKLLQNKDISFIEIATVCTAFFKSNYKHCSLDFMNSLRDVLFTADLLKHPSYHIVGIMKVFRQNYYGYSTLFERIGSQISKEAFRYPIKSIMQFVLTFATLHILHKELMDVAAREVVRKIHQCRSKDVAKFLWSYATLNYMPADWKQVVDTLQSRAEELHVEMESFPIYFISSLLSLAYMNIYPSTLLKIVFSDNFLQHIKDYEERERVDLRSNLYMLASSASLECPEKLEHGLNLEYLIAKPFPHHMLANIKEELKQRSELRDVADCIKYIVGGTEFYRVHCILPYMRAADIEIHIDETNTALAINDTVPTLEGDDHGSILLNDDIILHLTGAKCVTTSVHKEVPEHILQLQGRDKTSRVLKQQESKENPEVRRLEQVQLPQQISVPANVKRIVVQVSARNHHHFGGKKLLGLHNMKRRHLTQLGYQVVNIPYHDWELVGKSGPTAKETYLKRKIFGRL